MKNFSREFPKLKLFLGIIFLLVFVSVGFAALNLTVPVPTPTTDTTPSFTFSSDAETGTITYQGGCTGNIASIATTGSHVVTYNALSDGTYNCSIVISGTTMDVTAFEIDTTGPTFTFNNASSSENTTGSLSVTSVSDGGVGLHATPYNYSTDGINRGGWTTTNTYPLSNSAEPGNTTIRAKVRDSLGNESTGSATYTRTNIAPTANAISNSGDEGSTVLLTSNVSDPGGSTYTYQRYSDSSCASPIGGETSATYTAPAQNEPTTINYSYKTYDAQSLGSNCVTATAIRNNVAPTMSTLTNNGSVNENSQITWTAAGGDTGGGTIEYEFYNGSCGGTIVQAYSSTDTYSQTLTEPTSLTIYARSRDAQGLESSCLSSVGTWDNIAPTANAISNSGDEGSTVLLTSNVSDPGGSTYTYQRYSDSSCASPIGGETSATYTAPAQNEPTTINYSYKTYDAQSLGSNCVTATAIRNNVAPGVGVIDNGPKDETQTITWTATPSDPGGSTYTYQRYSDNSCLSSVGGETGSTTQVILSDQGTSQRYVIVTDNNGGNSSCQGSVGVWNNIVPTASDFTLSSSVGSSTVTGNWETLSSASDVAGINDPLTAAVQTQATKGTCSILSDIITYSPSNNQTGSDSCTVRINDGDGGNVDIIVSLENIDTFGPILTEVTPVTTPTNDVTPSYTFSSTEAGTIIYGGGCSSSVPTAIGANNTITFNTLSEGVYNGCTIRVIDGLGNTGNTLNISSFTIDTTKPTATVSYSPSSLTNTDVLATLTGENESITIDSVGGDTHNFVLDGTHLFEFTDDAGNTGETLATVNWIDKVPPELTGTTTITSNNTNSSFAKAGDTVMITFSVSEDLISNPSVNIVGGGSMNFMSKVGNTYVYSRNMTSGDPDGTISISVAMEDLATNTNSETEGSTITFDKTAPAGIFVITPATEEWVKGSNGVDPAITYGITRNVGTETNYGSNPLQIQYSSIGDFSDTYDISTGTDNDGSYSWTIPANYNTDTALLRIIATDLAGNVSTFYGNSFNIDSIRPTEIIITTPDGNEFLKGGDVYNFAKNGGDESNIATQQYRLSYNGGGSSQAVVINPGNQWAVPSNINRQDVTMNMKITDKAGWRNDGNSSMFTIDNTNPTLSFTNNSARRNTTVVGSTTVGDNFALWLTGSVAVYKDTAFTSSCDGGSLTVPTYSSDGTYTSYACVADRAGNVTTGQQTYNIDKTNPYVEAGIDQIVNGIVTQDADIYDVLSGGVMSDINTILRSQVSGPGTASFSPSNTGDTDITASLDGDYVLRLTVIDHAGNSSSDTINFTRDTVDPVITGGTIINTTTSSPGYSFESNETGSIVYSGTCSNGSISTVSIGTNSFNYSSRGEATYTNCQLLISDQAGNQVTHTVPTFTVSIPSGGGGGGGGSRAKDDCSIDSDLPGANEEGEDYSDSRYDETCLAEEDEEEIEEEVEEEDQEELGIALYGTDKSVILDMINIPDFDDSKFESSMGIIADYIANKVSKKSVPSDELGGLINYFNTFLTEFADYKNNGDDSAQDDAVVALSTFMAKLNQYPDASSTIGGDELSMAIQFLYQNGLTKYSTKSTFRPDALITREQAAKFLVGYAEKVKGVKADPNRTYVFTDINDGDPTLKDYVLKSYQMKIFNGYGSVFKPHWNLTKGGALAVLLRIYYGESLSEYNYPWYKEYYNKALELGLTTDENIRSGDSDITRGELALFIYRISQK